jgi:hypothetical protein
MPIAIVAATAEDFRHATARLVSLTESRLRRHPTMRIRMHGRSLENRCHAIDGADGVSPLGSNRDIQLEEEIPL